MLRRTHGVPPSAITAVVTRTRGWLSGGTLASALLAVKAVVTGEVSWKAVMDPHLLQPQVRPTSSVIQQFMSLEHDPTC